MLRIVMGLMVIGGGALPEAVHAADPSKLVQQLADPSFIVRDAAAKELIALRSLSLATLQEAINRTTDPAVRERAEALLPRIERLVESERILTPKMLKADYQNVPLSSVIDDVKKQTGIPLLLIPEKVNNPSRPITWRTEELPVWQAIESLCTAAGLREETLPELPLPRNQQPPTPQNNFRVISYGMNPSLLPYYTPSTAPILLVDGKADPLPGSRSSSIRVMSLPASYAKNRIVRGAGQVVIHFDVTPLPSLNWGGTTRVRVTRAEDEDGRPIFADESVPPASTTTNVNSMLLRGGGVWIDDGTSAINNSSVLSQNPRHFPVTLRTDDRAVKRLQRFEGVVLGEILRPNSEIVVVENMEKQVGRTFDAGNGVMLSVENYRILTNDSARVRVNVLMPQLWRIQALAGRARQLSEDFNINNMQNRLKFYDAEGRLCRPQPSSTAYSASGTSQSYNAEIYFASPRTPTSPGRPVKLVMTGTKMTTIEVPFAMENVRLP